MNTSQFMDKQIMDLSSSSSLSDNNNPRKDFIDLMSHPQDKDNGGHQTQNDLMGSQNNEIKEEIVPSYDFQPIRPLGSSLSIGSNIGGPGNSRIWRPDDSRAKNYGSIDSIEPALLVRERDRNSSDSTMVTEIDHLMKKHTDNLIHMLDGVSARLTQLESRTRHLENSVDDLKTSVGNNHGSTDGKMRQLENILREVQTGVQVLKDKQEIIEAQLQLSKLKVSKPEQSLEKENPAHVDSAHPAASAPVQSHQQYPPAGSFAPPHSPVPPVLALASIPAPAPGAPLQQNLPPPVQHPSHFPHSQVPSVPQREAYCPLPGQVSEVPNQQYQVPSSQQSQAPPVAPPTQPYQPVLPAPQFPQPPQPPQPQPSLPHHPEETPYLPAQSYPPNIRQPTSQSSSGSVPAQTYYGAPTHMYETPSSRPSSGFPSGYGPQSGPGELYPYGGTAPQYGSGSPMKPPQLPPAVAQNSGLPTARILPHALPTASVVASGLGSPRTGNRVPVDDVVDKVTSMGFPRDHVRATVRKLTENGQSVDLNMVLDKLMNDGDMQPQRGWFGR